MKTIEQLAAEHFDRYSMKETGKRGSWNHLNSKRKAEWMKEVFETAYYVVSEIQKELKPLPSIQRHDTSYAKGVHEGVIAERHTFMQLLEDTLHNLKQQIKEVENSDEKN